MFYELRDSLLLNHSVFPVLLTYIRLYQIKLPYRARLKATSISEREKMNKSYSTDSIVVDGYRANIWRQFYTLVKRQMMITFRNPLLFHLKLASHIIVGLVFGGLCWQIGNQAEKIDQNVSFVFLSMLFLLFSSMMPTLMQFPSDLRIMIAEYQNRWYSASAYFLAKTLSDLPFSIMFDMLFAVIGPEVL